MSKTYLKIVLGVNLVLFSAVLFLLLPPGMTNLTIIGFRAPFLVDAGNLMILVVNLASVIFASARLRPFNVYTKTGFLLSVAMLVAYFVVTLFFTGLQPV